MAARPRIIILVPMASVTSMSWQMVEIWPVSRCNGRWGCKVRHRGSSSSVSANPSRIQNKKYRNASLSSAKLPDDPSSVETLRFEEDVFESSALSEVTASNESARPDLEEAEERPDGAAVSRGLDKKGLVPNEWRHMQQDLSMTKRERKAQFMMQQRENTHRNELRVELRRQRVDFLSEAEESAHARSLAGSSRLFRPSQLKELERDFSVKPPDPRFLDKEFEEMFTFSEKGFLNRSIPDFSQVHSGKWPLLHMLASSGQYLFLERFIALGVELNEEDEDGYTPLQKAVQARRDIAVTQLLHAGANVHVLDKDGCNLLHLSAYVNSLHLLKLFVMRGVQVNHTDKHGWTPLHVAALTGRDDVVRHLILSGADQSITNKDGMTAMDIAMALGKELNSARVVRTLKRLFSVDLLA